MIFLTEGWFEFKGIKSSDMGIRLQSMPQRTVPGRKLQRKSVTGRNGSVAYGDESYDDAAASILCDVRDSSKLVDILAWLTGKGSLRFSDEPDLTYDASIDSGFTRTSIAALMSGQRFTVEWICAPFRRLYPEIPAFSLAANGEIIQNPGTAPARPKIEIRASGSFSLTIGMQTVYFNDVDGGIIVDSELGDAFTLDGTQLANDKMDGPLFEIQPGFNTVSWIAGSTDDEGNALPGTVTAVIITPRWRYI